MDWIESFRILQIEPTNDKKKIKIAYSKLLKKYNPEDYPDLFIKIQEAYETALKYSGNFSENTRNFNENNFSKNMYEEKSDEYEKMKVNGKYRFINRDKKAEHISDKSLFLYKMGLDKIFWSRDYLCAHPLSEGFGDEIVVEISQALYQAIKYLTDSIKIGKNNNWINEAKEKIQWAYEMNSRITKNLYDMNFTKTVVFS